jgi:hypothetical protein
MPWYSGGRQHVTKKFSAAHLIIMLYRPHKLVLRKAGFYTAWVTNRCQSWKMLTVVSPSVVHVRHKFILQTRAAPRQFSAVLTEHFLRIAVTEKTITTLTVTNETIMISGFKSMTGQN